MCYGADNHIPVAAPELLQNPWHGTPGYRFTRSSGRRRVGQKASSAPTVSLAMGQKHQPGRNSPDVTSSGRAQGQSTEHRVSTQGQSTGSEHRAQGQSTGSVHRVRAQGQSTEHRAQGQSTGSEHRVRAQSTGSEHRAQGQSTGSEHRVRAQEAVRFLQQLARGNAGISHTCVMRTLEMNEATAPCDPPDAAAA
ncbi:uncharacterized [Tachysurus ichikawai]